MYVCVAENVELLVFFTFFLHLPLSASITFFEGIGTARTTLGT